MLANLSCVLLTAPADGVSPALLLSITDTKRKTLAQYMFNAPEGISRLMLEHKVRPGLHLQALFLSGTDAAEAGGLGGMVLRAKQDGVAAVQIVGPAGASRCLSGIKSFISWQHPHINVTEPQQQQQQQQADQSGTQQQQQPTSSQHVAELTYADRNIQVLGFCTTADGSSGSSSPCERWEAPPWLSPSASIPDDVAAAAAAFSANLTACASAAAAAAAGPVNGSTTAGNDSSSSGSSSDEEVGSGSSSSSSMKSAGVTSSEDTTDHVVIERYAGADDSSSSSSSSSSSDSEPSSSSTTVTSSSTSTDSSSSSSSSSGDSEETDGGVMSNKQQMNMVETKQQQQQLLFSALDHVFASSVAAASSSFDLAAASAAGRMAIALTQAKQGMSAAAAAPGVSLSAAQHAANKKQQQQQQQHSQRVHAVEHKRQREQQQHQQQQCRRVKRRRALFESAACCCEQGDSDKQAAAAAVPCEKKHKQQQQQMLGYICHILPLAAKPSQPAAATAAAPDVSNSASDSYGQLLAVFYCRNMQQLAQLQQQPAVAALCGCSSRVLFICHVTPAVVARSAEYQQWMRQLPGQQIMMEMHDDLITAAAAAATKDGSSSRDNDLGIRASARVLSRLNLVSPEVFPLPYCLARQQGMTRDDVAAVVQQAQQQQQQQSAHDVPEKSHSQPGSAAADKEQQQQQQQSVDVAADKAHSQPDGAAVEEEGPQQQQQEQQQQQSTHYVSDKAHSQADDTVVDMEGQQQQQQLIVSQPLSKVVYGKLLQQLNWQGLFFQPTAAAAASEYQYEWQQWADPDYEKQQQQQAHLEPLVVKQLQQELLEQRPKLQQLLLTVHDRFASALQKQQQQQQQQPCLVTRNGVGSSSSSKKCTNKSAAQLLRLRLANKVPEVQRNVVPAAATNDTQVEETSAAATAAAAAVGCRSDAQSIIDDDVDAESAPDTLTQPWAAETSVIFLGTGSAEPSKYRGPSAILLRIAPGSSSSSSGGGGGGGEDKIPRPAAAAAAATAGDAAAAAARWLLLDAGEGTLGAIKRHMGPAAATAVITNLGLIWISHKHADHMLGVPALLQARLQLIKQQQQQQGCAQGYDPVQGYSCSSVLQQPLLLVGPWELLSWLQHLPCHSNWQYVYHFVPLTAFSGALQSSNAAVQQQQAAVPPPSPPPTPPPEQQQQQLLHIQQQQQQQQQQFVWQQQQQHYMMQRQQLVWQQQQQFMMQQGCGVPWFHANMQHCHNIRMQPMVPGSMQHPQLEHPIPHAAAAAAAMGCSQQQLKMHHVMQQHLATTTTTTAAAANQGMVMHRSPRTQSIQQVNGQPQKQQQQQSVHCNGSTFPPPQQQQQQSLVHSIMCDALGFVSWQSVAVRHCAGAHGLVLVHKQGWKLVYSGDTRPCAALTAAGAGATLLIHESTFEDDLAHHARAKGHSTMKEAMKVAADMKAYRTVLTHFSQRYPRLPAGYPADAKPWSSRPLLAVDGAVVNFALLPVLPALMPAVAAALEEIEEE